MNVAARARGTPNLALLEASTDPRVAPLLGKLVRFEVGGGTFSLQSASLADAQAFWDERAVDPIVLTYDVEREGLPGFREIGFADSIAVGVKAANLAELHPLLPDETPDGFAVPFRYCDEHLQAGSVTADSCAAAHADCVAEGRGETPCTDAETLCTAAPLDEDLWGYAARLLATPAFVTDSALRDAALASLRYHIANTGLSGVVYVQATPVSCVWLMSAQAAYEVVAQIMIDGNIEPLPGAAYDYGGNHNNDSVEFTYEGKTYRYHHSSFGFGWRSCQPMDCAQITQGDVMDDGCTCDRTHPIVCSPIQQDGTYDPLDVDNFAVCLGDSTCGN